MIANRILALYPTKAEIAMKEDDDDAVITLNIKTIDKLVQTIIKRGAIIEDLNHNLTLEQTQYLEKAFFKVLNVKTKS